jgi:hypothetical protein
MTSYRSSVIVTADTLSRSLFNQTANSILDEFTLDIAMLFDDILQDNTNIMRSAMIPSAFNVDWLIEFGDATNDHVIRYAPRYFTNSTCHCGSLSQCREPLRIGPPDLWLPGQVIGCLPIEGLRMSTLECYYSASCIQTILMHLEYYAAANGSLPVNFTVPLTVPQVFQPLNPSLSMRFSPTTPIDDLIDQLFVDEWLRNSSYESYYTICAPKTCRYTLVKRRSMSYVMTTLLSFYGGLTLGWRMIIWAGVRSYRKIRGKRSCVHPFPLSA